jgi:hypothetical protein
MKHLLKSEQPAASQCYAGIGSRSTPPEVLAYMHKVAARLAQRGLVLRSGAAAGADSAFEAGCDAGQGGKEIWLPWRGFNGHSDTGLLPTEAHFTYAADLHPGWLRLSHGAKKLHARNVGQVLGQDIESPVAFVLCWTPDGCESEMERTMDTGGTGTAIALASRRAIPVFNLRSPGAKDRLADFMAG